MSDVIGVVGAGAMGAGIAQIAAVRGHEVLLTDANVEILEKVPESLQRIYEREISKGRMTAEDAKAASERLRLVSPKEGLSAFSAASLVIEAIVERLDIKQATFVALEAAVSDLAVLATNTSSLSIASIAAECRVPERVLGVHFFNPAPVMPLVEIVPGIRTDSQVVTKARTLIDAWGKTTVVASDTPGFIVNRIARPFYSEPLRMLEEGIADIATLDWAMKEIGGFRMGPFELMDFIGHDVNYVVTESVWTAMYFDPRYTPSLTQKRLLEAGLLGRKSGRGFYNYAEGVGKPAPVKDPSVGERIVTRVLAMLINEAVDAVARGVATRRDVELAMTKGVNYPRGLLEWGDAIGLAAVLAELERLREESGETRYRPSPLLRRCVAEGRSLLNEE